jgi:tRNA A-37 threonylcarbamoyl transferase component Bud32
MGLLETLPQRVEPNGSFDDWWNSHGQWVEQPNRRRGGESGVQRLLPQVAGQPLLYLKRQTGHLYRSVMHPLGRPTLLREQRALIALRSIGIRAPTIIYCSARKQHGQWQALLVTEALDGFVSLDEWYASGAPERWGYATHRHVLQQIGLTLGRLHRHHWQHGCCYPKHLFIRVHDERASQVEIALLDLEKCRRRPRATAARHDLDQLKRHRGAMPEADWQLLAEAHQAGCRHPAAD